MNYFQEYEVLKEVRKLIPIKSEWISIKPTGIFSVGQVVYIQRICSHPHYTTETVVNFSYNGYAWFSRTKEEFLRHFRPSRFRDGTEAYYDERGNITKIIVHNPPKHIIIHE